MNLRPENIHKTSQNISFQECVKGHIFLHSSVFKKQKIPTNHLKCLNVKSYKPSYCYDDVLKCPCLSF